MARSCRLITFRYVVAASLCGIAFPSPHGIAFAQLGVATFQGACSQDGAACPGKIAISVQDNFQVVKHQPYEAQAVTETAQALADGSHITQSTTEAIARDSEGRTVRTLTLDNGSTFTTIFDPVAKTHIDYTSEKQIAHVIPLPTPPTLSSETPVAVFASSSGASMGPVGAGEGFILQGKASQMGTGSNTTTESLGKKAIDGIDAVGTRSTTTIPAGSMGNDKDLTITQETWWSPDLKLVVKNIRNDPRFGQMNYSLSNIQRNEPESTLFQVPPNYKTEEVPLPQGRQ